MTRTNDTRNRLNEMILAKNAV